MISVTNDLIFNTILFKFSKSISQIESSQSIFIPYLKFNSKIYKLAKSFRLEYYVSHFFKIFLIFFKNFFRISYDLYLIKDGNSLEKFKIKDIEIGKHIYDYILRKNKIPTINKLSFINNLEILLCLYYFYLIHYFITKFNVRTIITLDNVYIEGIAFELSKHFKLKMYTGFDINLLTLHYYSGEDDYKNHCRTPDKNYIDKKFKNKIFQKSAYNFLVNRFEGKHNQHDAKRAFSKSKIKISRKDLIKEYSLNKNFKNVLILPHIFCDAPHAYPSVFFKDYYEWLTHTINKLKKNKNINILLKEHPSASLYNEQGYLKRLIKNKKINNLRLISNEINSKYLMKSVDVLVTCGGTSGIEYVTQGIPVIIACSPPYSNFDFINKANNKIEYDKLLENATFLAVPSKQDKITSTNLLYLFFENYGIDKKKANLDCYNVNLGESNDLKYFFKYLSREGNVKHTHNFLVKSIEKMIMNKFTNLYKN